MLTFFKNSTGKVETLFLQLVIVVGGIVAAGFLLWEPHIEGVNAHATFIEVYIDPFIWLVYIGSIAFFVALYQAFKILGRIRRNEWRVPATAKAFRTIQYCAYTIIGFIAVEEFIILNHGDDDAAGVFALGIFITVGSVIVATAAALFEKVVRSAMDR